ncbi:MAG TPA: DMT family transporter [Longimicrobiales bacterium]
MTRAGGERRPLLGGTMVLGAAALWGTLGIFARALYAVGVAPLELASVRAAIGFVGLALWMLVRARRPRLRARDLPFFAAFGAISIALFEYAYFAAIERTTVAVAVALLYTAPAFVVVLSRLTGREAVGGARLVALAMVLAGVFLVTGAMRLVLAGAAAVSPAALAYGLLSGLTYGLYTIFGKRALDRYDPVETVLYAFAFGALALAVAAPPWRPMAAHPAQLPTFLMLGLLPTLASYLLYIGGLRHLSAGAASILACAEPVVAAILGAAVLGERLGADQVAGIALILGAAVALGRRPGADAAELRRGASEVIDTESA